MRNCGKGGERGKGESGKGGKGRDGMRSQEHCATQQTQRGKKKVWSGST